MSDTASEAEIRAIIASTSPVCAAPERAAMIVDVADDVQRRAHGMA